MLIVRGFFEAVCGADTILAGRFLTLAIVFTKTTHPQL